LGTLTAIVSLNLTISYQKMITTESNDPNNDWHNGIGIFVLKKQQIADEIWNPSATSVSNYI